MDRNSPEVTETALAIANGNANIVRGLLVMVGARRVAELDEEQLANYMLALSIAQRPRPELPKPKPSLIRWLTQRI